jgi:hypothetical protein
MNRLREEAAYTFAANNLGVLETLAEDSNVDEVASLMERVGMPVESEEDVQNVELESLAKALSNKGIDLYTEYGIGEEGVAPIRESFNMEEEEQQAIVEFNNIVNNLIEDGEERENALVQAADELGIEYNDIQFLEELTHPEGEGYEEGSSGIDMANAWDKANPNSPMKFEHSSRRNT